MSILPASRLSSSDLSRLGNNLSEMPRRKPRVRRRVLQAVNRSLACVGERIGQLHRPLMTLP